MHKDKKIEILSNIMSTLLAGDIANGNEQITRYHNNGEIDHYKLLNDASKIYNNAEKITELANIDPTQNNYQTKEEKYIYTIEYRDTKTKLINYADIKANNPNEAIDRFVETHPQTSIRELIGHRKNPETTKETTQTKEETPKYNYSIEYIIPQPPKERHIDQIDIKANNPNEAIQKFRKIHPQYVINYVGEEEIK